MYEIFDISPERVEVIGELWEKNRLHHEELSRYFKELYGSITFDDRIGSFKGLDKESIKITVAQKENRYIGYCISRVTEEDGELESLHVDKDSRGTGVGRALSAHHIKWMREKGCQAIRVKVAHENETAISFYRELEFFPNTLDLQLREEKEKSTQ